MPCVKLQEKARRKYVSVEKFMEQYDLSKSQAYRLLKRPEMQESIIKVGEKAIRVDLDRAFEIMQEIFK